MTKEELLASLLVERYDNRWWKTPPAEQAPDDDLTTARRRREARLESQSLAEERDAR